MFKKSSIVLSLCAAFCTSSFATQLPKDIGGYKLAEDTHGGPLSFPRHIKVDRCDLKEAIVGGNWYGKLKTGENTRFIVPFENRSAPKSYTYKGLRVDLQGVNSENGANFSIQTGDFTIAKVRVECGANLKLGQLIKTLEYSALTGKSLKIGNVPDLKTKEKKK